MASRNNILYSTKVGQSARKNFSRSFSASPSLPFFLLPLWTRISQISRSASDSGKIVRPDDYLKRRMYLSYARLVVSVLFSLRVRFRFVESVISGYVHVLRPFRIKTGIEKWSRLRCVWRVQWRRYRSFCLYRAFVPGFFFVVVVVVALVGPATLTTRIHRNVHRRDREEGGRVTHTPRKTIVARRRYDFLKTRPFRS